MISKHTASGFGSWFANEKEEIRWVREQLLYLINNFQNADR
jgi:hypothetical protein